MFKYMKSQWLFLISSTFMLQKGMIIYLVKDLYLSSFGVISWRFRGYFGYLNCTVLQWALPNSVSLWDSDIIF